MSGIVDLKELLSSLLPTLQAGEYVFCTVQGSYEHFLHLNPLATFNEPEGLTLVLPVDIAKKENLPFECVFKQITLTVHSSLEAVGLTAAVSAKLTSKGISANVVAAYYHDHIFVPANKAEQALIALKELSAE